ncbi:MAG: complex I NDUFA9 subunit family protein, partial [Gammaproteobacteria bacterium]|nr:complex I NDUFA9 subunit family protein [Gammaproteobacteria bacterium]
MSKLNIFMLGGTGFVGRSLAARLAEDGHQITVISRRRERHRELLVLPTLNIVNGDVHDSQVLLDQFKGVDVVINLVGILNERGRDGKGFHRVHVELPEKIAKACVAKGVSRLLHMSALNADTNGPSHYLRTKGMGEDLVHGASNSRFQVTSFRPSVIFGRDDSFTNRFADLLRRIPWMFPLACPNARFQPIYVDDVAEAFVRSLQDTQTFGQRYNLCGPETYSLVEIVTYIASLIGVKRHIIKLSPWQSKLQANVLERVPGKPFSIDNFQSLQIDSVCPNGFPKAFGLAPRSLEEIAPGYLGSGADTLSRFR